MMMRDSCRQCDAAQPTAGGSGERRIGLLAASAALLFGLPAAPLSGQVEPASSSTRADSIPAAWEHPTWLGLDFADVRPLGPLAEGGDDAVGFQFHLRVRPPGAGPFAIRLDAGVLSHSDAVDPVCFPPPIGCLVAADVVTALEIFYVGIGPEASFWRDRAYLFATLGGSSFQTSSFLQGGPLTDPVLFSTRHLERGVLSTRVGGGVRIPLGRRPARWRLDVGVDYHRNGVVEYLRPEGITQNPDGTLNLVTSAGEANLVAIRVGVSLGLGRRPIPET